MACHEVARFGLAERRDILFANIGRQRAARMKFTACGRIGRTWDVALQNDPLPFQRRVGDRDCREQGFRIRVQRV